MSFTRLRNTEFSYRSLDIIQDLAYYNNQKVLRNTKVVPALDVILSLPLKYATRLGYPSLVPSVRKQLKYWNNNLNQVIGDYEQEAKESRMIDGEAAKDFEQAICVLKSFVQKLITSYHVGCSKEQVMKQLSLVKKYEERVQIYSQRHLCVIRQVV